MAKNKVGGMMWLGGRLGTSLLCLVAGLAAGCGSGTEDAESREFLFVADGATESDQFFLIPADKVRDRVPEGYSLKTYESEGGGEMAQLFVTANQLAGGAFDGNDVGSTRVLHLAVEIEPPTALPPGLTVVEGAGHFYEVNLITNNDALADYVTEFLALPVAHEDSLDFMYEPSPTEGPGMLYGSAPMPLGFFSEAQFGPQAPVDTSLFAGYFWYESEKGLIVSQIIPEGFENIEGAEAGGEVCGEDGSWFADTVASGCAQGGGIAWQADVLVLSFQLWADY